MRNLLIMLFVVATSCGSSNNDANSATNGANNGSTTTANDDLGPFKEIAFRLTNARDMPVYVPGRPFVIYHGDELVEVAWGGCGCGNKCEQNFGPSFALAPDVTAAEVWYGTLLDTAECNLADDLVGETLEVEICWAQTVDDAMELADPTCERTPFVPGTDTAVVLTIE